MKKVLCLMLCLMMALSSVSALAATNEFGAYSDIYATNIYIEGKSDLSGGPVTILFKNGDTVGYINELETAEDGSYSCKFKFNDELKGYKLSVRDTTTFADITDTLVKVIAKKDAYSVDIDLNVSGNDVIKYASAGDILNVVADVENKYLDNANIKVMLAAYDANNKLLATDIQSLKIDYYDIVTTKNVEFSDVAFPQEAVKAKAFVWEDTINLIPVAKEQNMLAYGESRLFENKNPNPDDTWVVGLAGASTVQAGQYAAFLYQYYATRYPDKNIVILNKGCAGCTALDVYNRLTWDIFNEDDPMGFGACDEIAIMVGANDVGYSGYADGPKEDYEAFYNGENRYTNHPVASKNGTKVPNMLAEVEDSFGNYKKIVEWCKENGKGVIFTPMTVYDESQDFEHILNSNGVNIGTCYGTNHAFGMLSDRLEEYAKENGITFIDTWGMSDEYTNIIRANTDPAVVQYIDSKKGYVLLGKDGLHHSSEGGYVVGYIFARGQETDEIVASVEIDAQTSNYETDGATVSGLSASASDVSYTYLPKALPLYIGAPGYVHGEKLGVDITNTMNKEIIKVSGLESGTYTISMDGTSIGSFAAEQLENGVNIATLSNNPGQIQAKGLYDNYYERRKQSEESVRQIFNEELRIRNANSRYNGVDHNDPIYETYTAQDWIDLCNKLVDEGHGTSSAANYPERKRNQANYIADVRACIEGMRKDCIPTEHSVVISKN